MSFSFSSLIRLLVLMAVGSTIMAVGISRLEPPRTGWRVQRSAKYVNINEYFLDVTDRTPRWLDVETGDISSHAISDGDSLEAASCSPFEDEQGRRQVVGRWSSRSKDGPMSMGKDFGLARYTFPGGEMLDHVSTELVPVGHPIWFPGTRARVLFAAGDGKLYHFAFEGESRIKAQTRPDEGRDTYPRPLAWSCPKPGNGDVFMGDLSCPDDPRMGGRILVTLREQVNSKEGPRSFSGTQIWWLKLNHAGTAIVEAGRLVNPVSNEGVNPDLDERSPTIGTLSDGRLVLAFLRQRPGNSGWALRMGPIRLESDLQIPMVFESNPLPLPTPCQPAHPAFSSDGKWLSVIIGSTATEGRVTRLRISEKRGTDPGLNPGEFIASSWP